MPFIPLTVLSNLDESDRLFMERLYHNYHRLMFYQAHRYFQDQELIEDTVQQTCLKLIRYIPTIKNFKCNILAAYIVNVVKTVAMDYFRKQETERTTSFTDFNEDFEENLPDTFDLECVSQRTITIEKLKMVILLLPEGDKFVLQAKYLQGWSDEEIACVMGIKKGTVRSRLFRAKRKALQLLRGNDEE